MLGQSEPLAWVGHVADGRAGGLLGHDTTVAGAGEPAPVAGELAPLAGELAPLAGEPGRYRPAGAVTSAKHTRHGQEIATR